MNLNKPRQGSLIFSISGVRGVVGEGFTPEDALRLSLCFGSMLPPGPVVLGRDTRPSGDMIQRLAAAGLASTGHDVITLGIAPSPVIAFGVKSLKAAGGIVVSASHNPPPWNALKFLGKGGATLGEAKVAELEKRYSTDSFKEAAWLNLGRLRSVGILSDYRRAVVLRTRVEAVRRSHLHVVVDAGNGAGGLVTPGLLKDMGCEVSVLNVELDGNFRRPIEPTRESLGELAKMVVSLGADIGFAHDCDADRLVCVTEKGEVLGEDMTLALVVDQVLSKGHGGIVVTNVASSMVFDDIAECHGAKVIRTRVGEAYVVEKMMETGAIIGGEGSCGGVTIPDHVYTRDGILAAAKVAEALALREASISEVVAALPRYHMAKANVPCSMAEAREAIAALKERHAGEKLDLTDGVKVLGEKEWALVRPSGTEPIIRVMAEAQTLAKAEQLCQSLLDEVRDILRHIGGKVAPSPL